MYNTQKVCTAITATRDQGLCPCRNLPLFPFPLSQNGDGHYWSCCFHCIRKRCSMCWMPLTMTDTPSTRTTQAGPQGSHTPNRHHRHSNPSHEHTDPTQLASYSTCKLQPWGTPSKEKPTETCTSTGQQALPASSTQHIPHFCIVHHKHRTTGLRATATGKGKSRDSVIMKTPTRNDMCDCATMTPAN
jgi:hypothetical protein